jgi:hypothetical protein
MVVGGYAMAFHGFVRATGDIDLWINASKENSKRVWKALEKFRAPLFDLTIEDLQILGIVFQIGIVPNRIDIITQIDGVDFSNAFQDRETVEIENLTVPILSKSHLLKNKKSTGRAKDLNDVLWLESTE